MTEPRLPAVPPPESVAGEVRATTLERFKTQLERGEISLPNLGPMAVKVHELLSRPTCEADDVVKLIESDPTAAAEVLRVTNTARFRPPMPVTSVRSACLRLGNARVLGIAQEVLMRTALAVTSGPLVAIAERMWSSMLVVAQGARELATLKGTVDADEVYLAALLHNIGEMVLIRLYSDLQAASGESLDHAAMSAQIESLHEGVGGKLLTSWRMSPLLCRMAGEHHTLGQAPWDRQSRQIRMIIMLSWRTSAELGYSWLDPAPEGPSEELIRSAGFRARTVLDVFSHAPKWLDGT